ncbi:hypothetical protein GTO27_08160 [Candidatus Bathyarchaeota archaeon]|nr:hypothetical protein [Candidatus Bathyarchaeota archaeon]
MKAPRIQQILKRFKDFCKFRGWEASDKDDSIRTGSEYHSFIWTRTIHPSSFEKIATNGKCVVREGMSYRIVEPSYTAWLFSEEPSEYLIKTVFANPDFSKRIAIYNLGPIFEGKRVSFKLNNTNSSVFREFEGFLKKKLKVRVQPMSDKKIESEEHVVENLS